MWCRLLDGNNLEGPLPPDLSPAPTRLRVDISNNPLLCGGAGLPSCQLASAPTPAAEPVEVLPGGPPSTSEGGGGGGGGGGKSSTGALVGGIVGGVVLLALVGVGVWVYLTRQRQMADNELDVIEHQLPPTSESHTHSPLPCPISYVLCLTAPLLRLGSETKSVLEVEHGRV